MLSAILFLALAPSLQDPPTPSPQETLVAKARETIEAWVAKDEFSGTVILEIRGEVVLREAWGLANRKKKRPNTIETKFNVGSITKLFTSVAVGRLVEQGKLDWNDPVTKHLPSPPPQKAVTEKILLHHLLTHSSGLGDYWGAWQRASRSSVRDIDSYLALTKNHRRRFEPGSGVRYSNVGAVLTGAIIEHVTETDYYDHMREQLFLPIGMKNSDFGKIDPDDVTRAIGYQRLKSGKLRDASRKNPIRGCPAGGSFSNADDLLRFSRAFRDGTLLRPETARLISTRKLDLYPGIGYGYFCLDLSSKSLRRIGHDGGSEGVNAELWMYPDHRTTIVALANVDHGADKVGGYLHDEVARFLRSR